MAVLHQSRTLTRRPRCRADGTAPFSGQVFQPRAPTIGTLQRRMFNGPWTFDMDGMQKAPTSRRSKLSNFAWKPATFSIIHVLCRRSEHQLDHVWQIAGTSPIAEDPIGFITALGHDGKPR
jgi:hypothetical protein